MVQNWKQLGLGIVLTMGAAIASTSNAVAQNITLDGTLGPTRTLNGPNYTIQQVDGQTVGSNLFHSFGRFNLNIGEIANFQSAGNIRNILSRVTGGSPSSINGLIFTQSGNVNLFLINPSGIIFGPNARLDVGDTTRGSFIATTTDALVWSNGSQFSATNPGGPSSLLTIVGDPSGFLASVNQRRPIDVRPGSTLNNPYNGQSLLLIGGDVRVNGGTLQATGGRVELGGLAEPGTVGLDVSGNNLSLNFPANVARADVSFTNRADVNVASGGGGSIAVNARNIDVLGGSNLRAGISPLNGAVGAQAGDVSLNATGTLRIENSSVYNAAFDSGNAGNLRVDTGKLIVRDGVLATATLSEGRAGDVIVNARDSVELTGSPASNGTVAINIPINTFFGQINFPVDVPIGLFSASIDARNLPNIPPLFRGVLPTGGGNAGNLTIDTGRLIVSDGAVVSAGTTTTGRAGNLTVTANDLIELSGTSANDGPPGLFTVANRVPSGLRNETAGRGPGGNLTINTGRLIVRDGAWVTTGTGGEMPGGELTVNASESIELRGTSLANGLPSVFVSGTQGAGKASNLTINTRQLTVSDGAIISAGTSSDGQGGDLTINARDSVQLIGTSRQGLSAEVLQDLIGVSGGRLVFEFVENRPFPSGVISGSAGNGNAGNLTINTGRLLIRDGAQASVSTLGAGNAGNLTVRAAAVELTGTSPQSPNPNDIVGRSLLTTAVSQGSTGNGGDISVQTNFLTITDGAALTASTNGNGDSGNIFVKASDAISLANSSAIISGVGATAVGNGGNISIEANSLSLSNGAQLFAATFGEGNAGNIEVNVADAINLSGVSTNGFSSGLLTNTESGAIGQGGNIKVTSRSLQVSEGAVLSAVSRSAFRGGNITVDTNTLSATNGGQILTTAFSSGDAGNLSVNATERITLSGNDSSFSSRLLQFGQTDTVSPGSGLFANTESNSTGSGGTIALNTTNLAISEGAGIGINSLGFGSAGEFLSINARDTITVNNGAISSQLGTQAVGRGGAINLETLTLSLTNNAQVTASTFGIGDAGSITLTANTVEAITGGQFRTSTASGNNAGNITFNVSDRITLTGQDSGLFANTELGSTGNGGSIFIDPQILTIRDGARIAVDSQGTGKGGDIQIQAGILSLDNQALISAQTASNQGGNITLQLQDLLLLRRGSQISTTAGNANAGGDGGNITINVPFIVAVPTENSDISANAFTGRGGRVDIQAQSIFGIARRDRPTPLSDITASSELGVGGIVEINTPDIDPSRGLVALPTVVVDGSGLVASSCAAFGGADGSSFVVTGRGGLPPSPYEPLSGDVVWSDTRQPNIGSGENLSTSEPRTVTGSTTTPSDRIAIVPATGWVSNKKGEVTLISHAANATVGSKDATTCPQQ